MDNQNAGKKRKLETDIEIVKDNENRGCSDHVITAISTIQPLEDIISSDIGRKIFRLPQSVDLCLFYSMFNALRTNRERIAFTGGDIDVPHAKLLHCILVDTPKSVKDNAMRIELDGYNNTDMLMYLKRLKTDGHISNFKFTARRRFRVETIIGNFKPPTMRLAVVGRAVAAENRIGVSKHIQLCSKIEPDVLETAAIGLNEIDAVTAKIQAYRLWGKSYTGESYPHAICIDINDNGVGTIYDPSLEESQPLTIDNLAWSINKIVSVVEFNIVV